MFLERYLSAGLNKNKLVAGIHYQENAGRGKSMKRLLNTLYITSGNRYLHLMGKMS